MLFMSAHLTLNMVLSSDSHRYLQPEMSMEDYQDDKAT